jgi:hypothetical protein
MSDHVFIYLIVAFNSICQIMLIRRQKLASNVKWKFCCLAAAIPVVIMLSMRLLIVSGTIHEYVAEQSPIEHSITEGVSILLIAGPWLVTIAAILTRIKNRVKPPSQTVEEISADGPPYLPSKPGV